MYVSMTSSYTLTTPGALLLVTIALCGCGVGADDGSVARNDRLLLQNPHVRHQQKQRSAGAGKSYLSIKTQDSYFHVNEDYISSAIDMGGLNYSVNGGNFDFNNTRMRTLLRGLTPTTLRFGGSPADYTAYFRNGSRLNTSGIKMQPFIMSIEYWDNLMSLTLDTGARFLFDLNLHTRWGVDWDPINAMELFNRCAEKGWGTNIDWELGNESGLSPKGMGSPIPAKQIGKDFVSLRKLLNTYPGLKGGGLVGPDVIGVVNHQGQEVLKAVANVGSSMTALTFHQYYFRGDTAKWQSYIDPSHFTELSNVIGIVKNLIANSSRPDLPMWIGETADAWHEGTKNVSDRFISGFLWLDKLGLSAQMGVSLVIRQTFYGHYYGLLDSNMHPNPDYWLSYIHKKLVGTQVLQPSLVSNASGSTQNGATYFRIYAHCTNPKAGYPSGSITVFALNMSPNITEVVLLYPALGTELDMFLLEPSGTDGLLSSYVALNGVRILMPNDSTLPPLKPVPMTTEGGVEFPPLTFGFFVLKDVQTSAC